MAARPTNKEDLGQRVLSDEAVKDAMPDGPVCPTLPDVIFAQLPPEAQSILSLVNTGVTAAIALSQRTKVPLSGDTIYLEVGQLFSDAAKQVTQTAERVAEEIKDGVEDAAAFAWEQVVAGANTVQQTALALEQGVIDIGKELKDIDDITMNAIEKEFPGFKSAIDCLKGEPGSGPREGSIDAAKTQADTAAPANPAQIKAEAAVIHTKTVEEISKETVPLNPIEQALVDEFQSITTTAQVAAIFAGAPLHIDQNAKIDKQKLARDRQENLGFQVVTPEIIIEGDVYYAVFDALENVIGYDIKTNLKVESITKEKLFQRVLGRTGVVPQVGRGTSFEYNRRFGVAAGDPR